MARTVEMDGFGEWWMEMVMRWEAHHHAGLAVAAAGGGEVG